MGLRYLGGFETAVYNPLASNITSGTNTVQTQGVFTLQQQAQAQTQQQWVTDPNFKNTTLLLQADNKANGSQNNTFLDSSANAFTITRNGNTTQGSFSPFSAGAGYWGNYFSGSGTYLNVTPTTAIQFAAGDFTIEFWVNFTSVSSTQVLVNYGYENVTTRSFLVYLNSDNTLHFAYSTTGSNNTDVSLGALNPPTNTWMHIAVVRSGTTVTGYKDGVALSSPLSISTNTIYYPSTSGAFRIANDGSNQTLGYMSNVRLVKGTAVYTAAFTPPASPLTAISGTSFLSCQSNRFVDNSASPMTIAIVGTPSVQAFSPFAPQYQWTPDVIGGSGYFDGSGDYLTLTDNSAVLDLGGLQASFDCWIYIVGTGTAQLLLSKTQTSISTWANIEYQLYANTSGNLGFYYNVSNSSTLLSGSAVVANQWIHVCVATDASNNIALFQNGVRTATAVNAITKPASTTRIGVGAQGTAGADPFTGYISGARFIKGSGAFNPASTTITVPTAPPTSTATTQLLLNMTNAGIYDGKMNTSWETVNSAQVSTSTVKYGSGSIYFNGVASQRLLPSQLYPQLTPGTGDFTIECWLYIVGKNATTIGGIIDYRPGVNGTYINWVVDFGGYSTGTASAPILVLYADSAVFITSSVISMGQWNHVALCRANGYTRMFINGTLASAVTADTKNYASGGSAAAYRPCIGSTDGGDSLYGYIDDFRISRFARYIANFTPPQVALPRQ